MGVTNHLLTGMILQVAYNVNDVLLLQSKKSFDPAMEKWMNLYIIKGRCLNPQHWQFCSFIRHFIFQESLNGGFPLNSLAGDFNCFCNLSPRNLRKGSHLSNYYFSNGLKPPSSSALFGLVSYFMTPDLQSVMKCLRGHHITNPNSKPCTIFRECLQITNVCILWSTQNGYLNDHCFPKDPITERQMMSKGCIITSETQGI